MVINALRVPLYVWRMARPGVKVVDLIEGVRDEKIRNALQYSLDRWKSWALVTEGKDPRVISDGEVIQ